MGDNGSSRETLGSRLGFILLTAGCAIGLGNIWRFPFVTGQNGGALFVLIYLVFLFMLGFPVMVMELSLGRASRRNLYGAYKTLPKGSSFKWHWPGAGVLHRQRFPDDLLHHRDRLDDRLCGQLPERFGGRFGE